MGVACPFGRQLEGMRHLYDLLLLWGEKEKKILNHDPTPNKSDVSSEGYGLSEALDGTLAYHVRFSPIFIHPQEERTCLIESHASALRSIV